MGLSTREGAGASIGGRRDGGTSFGVVRPPRQTNSGRPAFHRFRASHPKGRNEVEHPGGAAGGVDGRGRGGRLGMLRTGGRLTGRGLVGPSARGNGGGGPRTQREWITRARLRRASGVTAARARSAPGVDRGRAMPPRAWRRLRRRGWGSPPACLRGRDDAGGAVSAARFGLWRNDGSRFRSGGTFGTRRVPGALPCRTAHVMPRPIAP